MGNDDVKKIIEHLDAHHKETMTIKADVEELKEDVEEVKVDIKDIKTRLNTDDWEKDGYGC